MRELVEDIEARGRVLDLDRVEVQIGGQPPHSMRGAAVHTSLRAPEGMSRDRQATLLMNRVDRGRSRHSRPHPALEEESDDLTIKA